MPDHLWTGLVFTPSLSGTASDLRTSRASRRSPRGPGWTLNRPAHNGSLPRFPICAALASWPLEGPYGPSVGPEHRSQPVGLSVTHLRELAGRTAAPPGPRIYPPRPRSWTGSRPLAPGPAERPAGHPGTRATVRPPPWKDRAVRHLSRGGPAVSHSRRRQRKVYPGTGQAIGRSTWKGVLHLGVQPIRAVQRLPAGWSPQGDRKQRGRPQGTLTVANWFPARLPTSGNAAHRPGRSHTGPRVV